MTSPARLETSIKDNLAPLLRSDGFTGSGLCFRKVAADFIQVIAVQSARGGGKFCINLGIHPVGIPDVLGAQPDPRKFTDDLCEFRRRLTESGADQWWEHDMSQESMNAAVQIAAHVYESVGRNLFAAFSTSDSPLHTLSPQQLEDGPLNLKGFSATKVRMALALGRFRKISGRLEEAKAFAEIGIRNLGSATSLRRQFEAIGA